MTYIATRTRLICTTITPKHTHRHPETSNDHNRILENESWASEESVGITTRVGATLLMDNLCLSDGQIAAGGANDVSE